MALSIINVILARLLVIINDNNGVNSGVNSVVDNGVNNVNHGGNNY